MNRRQFLARGTSVVVLGLAGCSSVGLRVDTQPDKTPGNGKGPPDHAPAHGYRRKHASGVELVFDSERGVYLVVDYPDYYFFDDKYYRRIKDRWEVSVRIEDGWVAISNAELPPGLRDASHPGKGHGRGKKKHTAS